MTPSRSAAADELEKIARKLRGGFRFGTEPLGIGGLIAEAALSENEETGDGPTDECVESAARFLIEYGEALGAKSAKCASDGRIEMELSDGVFAEIGENWAEFHDESYDTFCPEDRLSKGIPDAVIRKSWSENPKRCAFEIARLLTAAEQHAKGRHAERISRGVPDGTSADADAFVRDFSDALKALKEKHPKIFKDYEEENI